MILPSLRQLQYFVRIAELGSYRRAAETFGMSQPPLTQQMQALEQRLGVRLFDRASRRVVLTAAGESLLADAQRLLGDLVTSCALLSAIERGEAGRIRAGMTDDYLTSTTVDRLLAFVRAHPHVRLQAEIGVSTDLISKLEDNELDLVLASRMPVGGELIEQHRLPASEIVLLVAAAHPLAGRRVADLSQLADEAWILMPDNSPSPFARRCRDLLNRANIDPRVLHCSSSASLTARLVADGLGIAFASRGSVAPSGGRVAVVPLNDEAAALEHALFVRAPSRTPALRALVEALLVA